MDSQNVSFLASADKVQSILIGPVEKCFLIGVTIIVCELLYRIIVIFYEYGFKWKHYAPKRRFLNICKFSLKCSTGMYFALPVVLAVFLVLQDQNKALWYFLIRNSCDFSIPYVVLRALSLSYSNVELAKWVRSGSGVDYATGMASNYFHGYLHLQLPETGHRTKAGPCHSANVLYFGVLLFVTGLKERIEEYEDTERVFIPIKKLFILIPESMHTKPKIHSEIMTAVKPLDTVNLDRAGVKRPFKNAVYRIAECGPKKDKNWYVVLEGATPLMSFYEGLTYQITCTSAMNDMRREITLQFWQALRKITTDCPDTKGLVELVYYNDITADGKDVDVGKIVRARIEMLMSRNDISSI